VSPDGAEGYRLKGPGGASKHDEVNPVEEWEDRVRWVTYGHGRRMEKKCRDTNNARIKKVNIALLYNYNVDILIYK